MLLPFGRNEAECDNLSVEHLVEVMESGSYAMLDTSGKWSILGNGYADQEGANVADL